MINTDAICDAEGVIITGELGRRPSRAPDFEGQARALTALAEAMTNTPGEVLQQLVEVAMDMTHSDSAGISLLEPGGERGRFRWVATTGAWAPYRNGAMPRGESPCGEVVAREAVLLMKNPERAFPALRQAQPAVHEVLLAPFQIDGAPVGTVWVIKHGPERPFEAEDARLLLCLARFASAAQRMVLAREASEARFRAFSDASTHVLWIRDATTLRMEFASPAFQTIYGLPGSNHGGDSSLRSWARLIDPASRKAVFDNFRRVRAGERVELEFRIRRAGDGASRWVHGTDFPLRDAAGEVRWLAGVGADITDAKVATDQQGMLVAELQHRTRNLIGVVRALSDRTLHGAASLEDFGRQFSLRLSALSRVQGLLSHIAAGARVTFSELLRAELAAHGATSAMGRNVTLTGPDRVPLRSRTVQTLALALHELATNAVKYGALASAHGRLSVRWDVERSPGLAPLLHVDWRETGVVMPEVGAPARGGGYGRELIERALPYQLGAKTSYELTPQGVHCRISVPISRAETGGR